MCSRCKGYTITLSADEGRQGMVIEPKCKSWKCPECGQDRRNLWIARAAVTIMALAIWEVSVCDPKQFTALAARLRKHDRIYYRIRFGTLNYVFHQPLVANRKHKLDESQWMSSGAALAEFTRIIMAEGVDRVSCSRGLQRPVTPIPGKAWKREAFRRKSVGEYNHLLQRLCIDTTIQPVRPFDGRLVDVILLRGFPDMRTPNNARFTSLSGSPKTSSEVSQTRIIRPSSMSSEPSWDDIRCDLLVT